MNATLPLSTLLPDPITTLTSEQLMKYRGQHQREMRHIIDSLGMASARAQSLRMPITTFDKMMENKGHCLYILKHRVTQEQFDKMGADSRFSFNKVSGYEVVVGMIKMGVKKLFMTDEMGRHVQISPNCVLDFYVHESCQRSGYGKLLFDFMLEKEQEIPSQLAYDRPSPKLLGFLRKYFHLSKYIPQANKFLIFKEFGLWSDQKYQDVAIKPHSPYKLLPALEKAPTEASVKPIAALEQKEASPHTPVSNAAYPLPWPLSQATSARTVLKEIQSSNMTEHVVEEPVRMTAQATHTQPPLPISAPASWTATAAEPPSSSLLSPYATHYQTQFNAPFPSFYQQCQPYYPKHSFPPPRKQLKHHSVRLAPLSLTSHSLHH